MTTSPSPSTRSSLLRGTAVVAGFTLLSRILGFVREVLIARLFGATLIADAYFVAFRIPNLLRSIFAEGALTAAFVPVFASELRQGQAAAQRALQSILTLLVASTLVVTLLGVLGAAPIVSLFAPGFERDPSTFALCASLLSIMMPYIVCVSVVILLNGALNSVKVFGASALAQVYMNLVMIVAAIVAIKLNKIEAAQLLAYSVLLGGGVQIIVQIPALHRAGFRLRFSQHLFSQPSRKVLRLMLPAVLGAAVYQLSIFFNTQLASVLNPGSVAWLSYADRVAQLPIGIISLALSSVLLPHLAISAAEGDHDRFGSDLVHALRFTSFILIPIAGFLFLFAHPLVRLLFERGAFDAQASLMTAMCVQGLSLGLWAVSCHSLLVRALNARHDTRSPMLIGVVSLVASIVIAIALMGAPLAGHGSFIVDQIVSVHDFFERLGLSLDLGAVGLCLASSLAFTLSLMLAWWKVHHSSVSNARRINWSPFVLCCLKSLLTVICAGVGIVFLARSTNVGIVYNIAIYCSVLILGGLALRQRELFEIYRLIRTRLI